MNITGKQIIGSEYSALGRNSFKAINPAESKEFGTTFYEATTNEINLAIEKAEHAFVPYNRKTNEQKALFLEKIAEEILSLGQPLIDHCMAETGLPEGRLIGERGRTIGQLKLFAQLLREGSWLDARIDTAIPDRQPAPRPDIRHMYVALGPVGIFGASNFPLAFSVAGGDSVSALAAGCPIVVKAHQAHPATSELVAQAIIKAAKITDMPDGVFSMLQGQSVEVGLTLVKHPLIKAIGFTGSFRGGKAIFDAANLRPEPIPVYSEMGSVNPVFILPGALEQQNLLAKGLITSLTMGTGQFCTNPGLVILQKSTQSNQFISEVISHATQVDEGTMLTPGIKKAYENGVNKLISTSGVAMAAKGKTSGKECGGIAYVLQTTVGNILNHPELTEEVFGPATLIAEANDKKQILEVANGLQGHLTATIHGTNQDLEAYKDLITILERKVGRIIFNGFPTGVEVCHAMVHGGPFPATTNAASTSVGTGAIKRFVRPVCYQDFPQDCLPDALKNSNPLHIWRMVNGQFSKESI